MVAGIMVMMSLGVVQQTDVHGLLTLGEVGADRRLMRAGMHKPRVLVVL